jgi:D-alanine-D-alanine ligase
VRGLKVAVVVGGPSSEAEVSRTGGKAVHGALERAGHAATVIELDPTLGARLAQGQFDVVFPVIHGEVGEDGCLQGLLEVQGIPYVGSGVLASGLAVNKPHAKIVFRAAGLPVAKDETIRAGETGLERIRKVRGALGRAFVAKPASGGSALGVELVRADADDTSALEAVLRVLTFDPVALVESLVPGEEVTCGVLERRGRPEALPPTLIRPRAEYYDFQSKYGVGGSEHLCPAPFAPELLAKLQAAALTAHGALGCRDLSRTDFLVDESAGTFVVLETNTLPGMTRTSLFPEAADRIGISFEQLCDELVRAAAQRPQRRRPQAAAMPI